MHSEADYFKICEIKITDYYGRFSLLACIDKLYGGSYGGENSHGISMFKLIGCQQTYFNAGLPPVYNLYSVCRSNFHLENLKAICTEVTDNYSKLELFCKSDSGHKIYSYTAISSYKSSAIITINNKINDFYSELPSHLNSATLTEYKLT